ncbi:MAG: hypothetical protein LC667_19130 [Thioalkalivibrio sp.]|nr:hypothetical protein [Thioalkalivibrio sp.]
MIGAGAGSTIIDANGLSRVFNVQSSTSTFAGLTVRNGVAAAGGGGGGMNADNSQLTVRDSVITGNRTTGDGGGIDSDGDDNSLTLIRSPNGASGLSA